MKFHWKISFGQLCEIGDVKPTNQDRIFADTAVIGGKQVGLFVVADGVGGLARGEDISTLTTEYFKRWFESLVKQDRIEGNLVAALCESVEKINSAAYEFGVTHGERSGSTIALLLTVDEKYYICNVGDSRVYRYDGVKSQQLTYDHSVTADLVRKGEITREEAEKHPRKNVITMCLGVEETVNPYFAVGNCGKKDVFVICSDGFYNYADSDAVRKVLKNKKGVPDEDVSKLRTAIPENNALDNVSVILVKMKRYFSFG